MQLASRPALAVAVRVVNLHAGARGALARTRLATPWRYSVVSVFAFTRDYRLARRCLALLLLSLCRSANPPPDAYLDILSGDLLMHRHLSRHIRFPYLTNIGGPLLSVTR